MNFQYESPLKAIIDLKAFNHNIQIIRKKFPNSKIILPVKANAYGHGDIIIAKQAQKIGIEYLGVARVIEGINLRKNKITLPIINLGIELGNNIELAILNNIELSVSSLENIKEIEKIAKKYKKKIPLHLKTDTGMRRLGCPDNEALFLAKHISSSKNLIFKSFYSHFPKSDDDINLTKNQINIFLEIKKELEANNIIPDFYHIFNSGAILNQFKGNNNFAVRPGIMTYGYSPSSKLKIKNLKPVLTLKSKVIYLKKVAEKSGVSYGYTFVTKKPTYIATIPLGYGDGFSRILSNKFMVTINKKNYPQIGTISMDLSVIEVDKNVKIGDEVIIFGNKKECINTAEDLADLSNTISYEITTSLSNRIQRIPIGYKI